MAQFSSKVNTHSDVPLHYKSLFKCPTGESSLLNRLQFGDLSTSILNWRITPMQSKRSVREFESIQIKSTFHEFMQWKNNDILTSSHPLYSLPCVQDNVISLYADYIHFKDIFGEKIINAINWYDFDLNNEFKEWQSTLWIGTLNSHTPLHYDTYSTNLIVQYSGTKKWKLWPQSSNASSSSSTTSTSNINMNSHIKPLRIPYEESSVYSSYDPRTDASIAPAYEFLLEAGDVLFVPKHWWHYVETVSDLSISINLWMGDITDVKDRAKEALSRFIVGSFLDTFRSMDIPCEMCNGWLSPTESNGKKGRGSLIEESKNNINHNNKSNKYDKSSTSKSTRNNKVEVDDVEVEVVDESMEEVCDSNKSLTGSNDDICDSDSDSYNSDPFL
eukprot:gene6792-13751_t